MQNLMTAPSADYAGASNQLGKRTTYDVYQYWQEGGLCNTAPEGLHADEARHKCKIVSGRNQLPKSTKCARKASSFLKLRQKITNLI